MIDDPLGKMMKLIQYIRCTLFIALLFSNNVILIGNFRFSFSRFFPLSFSLSVSFVSQHSMIYFFHHYELPVIIQQAQVQQILRLRTRQRHQQQNGNGAHGTTNNASNIRNGPNAANQANNDTMGNNQMNNNGNNPNNNNHRNGNLLTTISFILSFQMAATLFNYATRLIGMLQGRLTNDVLGTAAFFNNNNDNSLNNNNNNNPTANITRLRINLSRLRRINLAGIQINPIQINPADGTENIRIDRDETSSGGASMAENSMAATVANASSASSSSSSSPSTTAPNQHSNDVSNSTSTNETNHHREVHDDESNWQLHHALNSSSNDTLSDENTFDQIATDDFDIIDANDDIEIKPNNAFIDAAAFDKAKLATQVADQHPIDKTPFYHNAGQSLDYDIQIQSIDSSPSNLEIEESGNTTASSNDKNHSSMNAPCIDNDMNSMSLINAASDDELHFHKRSNATSAHRTESGGQIRTSDDFPAESHSWTQGDRENLSIANTDIGICTELEGDKMLSSHAATVATELGESPSQGTDVTTTTSSNSAFNATR